MVEAMRAIEVMTARAATANHNARICKLKMENFMTVDVHQSNVETLKLEVQETRAVVTSHKWK